MMANMCESFRSVRILNNRMNFANALSANNILRRDICSNEMGTHGSKLSRSTAKSLSTVTATRGRSRCGASSISTTFTTRLFGSKRGVPGNPPGTVSIYNEQETLKDIDEDALRTTVERISKILGYETYDVTLLIVDDEEMRETNLESRGIDKPTDILSFPFHLPVEGKAGHLEDPEFDIPDYYTLGDMVVCAPYVIRRCKEDLQLYEQSEMAGSESDDESDLFLDEEDDRGVSGAMASVQDPEKRIRMLLVHGMLHLVGYDHIEDDDYIEMVEREEQLLKELGEL